MARVETDSVRLTTKTKLAQKVNSDDSLSSWVDNELRKYDIGRNARKLAIIINIKDFSGSKNFRIPKRRLSDVDESVVTNMLEAVLGFDVVTKHDLTSENLIEFFQELQIWDYRDVDTMAIVLMSYGNNRMIYSADGEKIEIKTLLDNLKGDNCIGLANKPKIIFINAGQYEETVDDVEADAVGYDEVDACQVSGKNSSTEEKRICIPRECDFIHVYSPVMSGHQKTGGVEQGNIFLTVLYEMCLKLQGEQLEFCDLLTRANRQVALRMSAAKNVPARPCFFLSTLTKELYLLAKT